MSCCTNASSAAIKIVTPPMMAIRLNPVCPGVKMWKACENTP